MSRVATEEDALVESVVRSDALADLCGPGGERHSRGQRRRSRRSREGGRGRTVDREPRSLAKLELERLKDLARASLADVLGRVAPVVLLLAVGARLGLELDVEAHEALLARDDHDRAVRLGVDEALAHNVGEVGLDLNVHHAPDDVGRVAEHADLALPLAVARLTARNGAADQGASTVDAKEVLGAGGELLLSLAVDKRGRDGVLLRLIGRAGLELVGAEDAAVRCGTLLGGGKVGAAL